MTAHDADTETIGETHLAVLKITIDPKVPLSKRRDTLLHEILHALVFTVGGWDKKQTEEEWIARSSTVLLGILRDNPEIVAYLTAED